MSDQTFTYDVEQPLTKNAYTRPGYTFMGWAESPNGGVVYSDQQSVINLTAENGGEVTLYAVWQENTEVTYTYVVAKGKET